MARASGGALPRLQNPADIVTWANTLVATLDLRLVAIERAYKTGYIVTNNGTPNRSLDAAAATLAQVRVVLATMIEDQKAAGELG